MRYQLGPVRSTDDTTGTKQNSIPAVSINQHSMGGQSRYRDDKDVAKDIPTGCCAVYL